MSLSYTWTPISLQPPQRRIGFDSFTLTLFQMIIMRMQEVKIVLVFRYTIWILYFYLYVYLYLKRVKWHNLSFLTIAEYVCRSRWFKRTITRVQGKLICSKDVWKCVFLRCGMFTQNFTSSGSLDLQFLRSIFVIKEEKQAHFCDIFNFEIIFPSECDLFNIKLLSLCLLPFFRCFSNDETSLYVHLI